MKYLGIDYGTKKIGLALSDDAGTMGFPYAVVANTPQLVDELCILISNESINTVVIGESRSLSGAPNPVAKGAHTLGDTLVERCGLPVAYESEVFTTAEAKRAPAKEPKSRKQKPRDPVDASAAALILSSYLSRQSSPPHHEQAPD